jgi:hypothetical protein
VNRRISIVVLTQRAEQEANKTDLPATQRAAVDSAVINNGATADAAPAEAPPHAPVDAPTPEAMPAVTSAHPAPPTS